MIQTKIFSILEVAKKIDNFKLGYKDQAVYQLIQEIKAEHTNINDAYVILDFLKSVSEKVLEAIEADTIKNVLDNFDNEALGVQLVIERTKEYHYEQDKDWSNINKTVSMYGDALKKREKILQDAVKASIANNTQPDIGFENVLSIIPRLVPSV
jgi:hypothetical protein